MESPGYALKDARGRILVVDDNPSVLSLLSHLLRREGFEVRTAGDGRSALAAFESERFDMILTDFRMPGMSGLELAAALRKLDAAVPIILVTGDRATLDTKAAAQVRISRVLEKPFKLDEFIACLSLLNAKHSA